MATPPDFSGDVAGKTVGDTGTSGTIDGIFEEFQRTPKAAGPCWLAARVTRVPFQVVLCVGLATSTAIERGKGPYYIDNQHT